MNRILNFAALLLSPADRGSVLGDLAESGASFGATLFAILGLALRQQFKLFLDWRPWLAGFGLALTTGIFLIGQSVAFCKVFLWLLAQTPTIRSFLSNLPQLALPLFSLIAESWAIGFAAATISRRTLWASILMALPICIRCFTMFRMPGLSPLCLLVFVPPTLFGLCSALRGTRPSLWFALLLAVPNPYVAIDALRTITATLLFWLPGTALLWPCWNIIWLALHSTRRTKEAYSL